MFISMVGIREDRYNDTKWNTNHEQEHAECMISKIMVQNMNASIQVDHKGLSQKMSLNFLHLLRTAQDLRFLGWEVRLSISNPDESRLIAISIALHTRQYSQTLPVRVVPIRPKGIPIDK